MRVLRYESFSFTLSAFIQHLYRFLITKSKVIIFFLKGYHKYSVPTLPTPYKKVFKWKSFTKLYILQFIFIQNKCTPQLVRIFLFLRPNDDIHSLTDIQLTMIYTSLSPPNWSHFQVNHLIFFCSKISLKLPKQAICDKVFIPKNLQSWPLHIYDFFSKKCRVLQKFSKVYKVRNYF